MFISKLKALTFLCLSFLILNFFIPSVYANDGLEVKLSTLTPRGTNVPFDALEVPLMTLELTAADTENVEVSSLRFTHPGDRTTYADFSEVWIKRDGLKVQTGSAIDSDGVASLSFAPPLTILSGQTVLLDVIGTSSEFGEGNVGAKHRLTLETASDVVSSVGSVAGKFPIRGEEMVITNYQVTAIDFVMERVAKELTTGKSIELGTFSLKNQSDSSKDIELTEIIFENRGAADLRNTLKNVGLYIAGELASANTVVSTNKITFQLHNGVTGGYILEDGQKITFGMQADVTTDSSDVNLKLGSLFGIEIGTDFGVTVNDETVGPVFTSTGRVDRGINLKSTMLEIPEKLPAHRNFPILEVELYTEDKLTKIQEMFFAIDTARPLEYEHFWIVDEKGDRISSGNALVEGHRVQVKFSGRQVVSVGEPKKLTVWAHSYNGKPDPNIIMRAVHLKSDADKGYIDGEYSAAMDLEYRNKNEVVFGQSLGGELVSCPATKGCARSHLSDNTRPNFGVQSRAAQADSYAPPKIVNKVPEKTPSAKVFTDLASTHRNQIAIGKLKEAGIIGGYADGTFKPGNKVNRAEFTKIVIGTKYADELDSCNVAQNSFPDVPAEAWFAPYVCVAKAKGIIKGYPDGTFGPDQNIKFVEAAKIVAQLFAEVEADDSGAWYQPFVNTLEQESAIPEDVSALEQELTRGQMSELIYRLKWQVRNKSSHRFSTQ